MATGGRAAVLLAMILVVGGCGSAGEGAPIGSQSPTPSTSASTPSPDEPPYVTARVTTGRKPCGVVGAEGKVWVSNYGDDTLVSIDPATATVSAPIPVGSQPCGLAYGAGSVWVEYYGSDNVTRVDAVTGDVVATIAVGSRPYDVTFADGAAWVTTTRAARCRGWIRRRTAGPR